jgi:hypothetical protein
MKPKDEIERLARTIRFEPDAAADRRILSAAEMALDHRPATPLAPSKRRAKLSLIKLAAAAVVTIAVALVVNAFLSTSHVVWAGVPDRVNGQVAFRSHSVSHTVEIDANGTSHSRTVEFFTSVSKEYGIVCEALIDGKPGSKFCELFKSGEHVRIEYDSRRYWKSPFSMEDQERLKRDIGDADPRRMVAKTLEGPYIKIGRKVIDGRVVEGVESSESTTMGGVPGSINRIRRLWIDVKTQLPVRSESTEGPYRDDEGVTRTITGYSDQFQWGAELPPDVFTPPEPPGGFKIMGGKLDETTFIIAMRAYVKSNGAYPEDLDRTFSQWTMKNSKLAVNVIQVRQLPTGEYCEDRIIYAGSFYRMLVEDGNSPFYYGDRVSAADSNAILMYWHVSGATYRVVWGDLRLETMQAGDMVHYLRGVAGGTAWTPDMARGHMVYQYNHPDDQAVIWVGTHRASTESSGVFAVAAPPADSNETWLAYAFGPQGTHVGKAFPLRASDRDRNLNIVLEPLCTIKGRIVDSAGQPRSMAAMWLVGHADDKKDALSMLQYPPTLESDGGFEIPGVPSGAALDLTVMVGSGGRTRVAVGDLTPGKVRDLGVIVLDDVKQDK